MKKPIIAITTQIDYESGDYLCRRNYVEKVIKAGGYPVLLPSTAEPKAAAECFDGFLLTGGGDIAPNLYGEEDQGSVNISDERDRFEMELAVHILGTGKPLLAICRGVQVLNVAVGGTLYQHLPLQKPSSIDHSVGESAHCIEVIEGTPLKKILKTPKTQVNSYHHQSIKNLPSTLKIAALAEDGVIEAVYAPDLKFCLGVQWHPERMENEESDRLFSEFINATN